MMDILDEIAKIPEAIRPLYQEEETNQALDLYNGMLRLDQNGIVCEEEGVINWQWLPRPFIGFDLKTKTYFQTDRCQLTASAINLTSSAYITGFKIRMGSDALNECRGRFLGATPSGKTDEVDYILFHLPNFTDYIGYPIRNSTHKVWKGRLSLVSLEWTVLLDRNETVPYETLKLEGGYSITHTGILRRTDNSLIVPQEAWLQLENLFHLFSFLRGNWTRILSVGYKDNKQIWQRWEAGKLRGWRSVMNWFPERNPLDIDQVFRGFLTKISDPIWNDTIKIAIHWFIEANNDAGGVEGGIVLIQNALELLCWNFLVEDRGVLSKTKFEDVSAADNIRTLLQQMKIPTDIPSSLKGLLIVASSLNASGQLRIPDGPGIFAKIRNMIVHPKKGIPILNLPFEARMQAKELGLWYLEMIILWLCDYNGVYVPRWGDEKSMYFGQSVPWI